VFLHCLSWIGALICISKQLKARFTGVANSVSGGKFLFLAGCREVKARSWSQNMGLAKVGDDQNSDFERTNPSLPFLAGFQYISLSHCSQDIAVIKCGLYTSFNSPRCKSTSGKQLYYQMKR